MKISDANIDAINFAEQASDFATPASGFRRLFFKADGLYAINDAGAVVGPLISADDVPASGPVTPDTPPDSPNAMDDEFEGSSLDAKWSWFNQGTSTATFDPPGAMVLTGPAASGDNTRGIVQPCTDSAWKFRMKLALQGPGADYLGGGFTVRNSSGAKNAIFGILYSNPFWRAFHDNRSDTGFAAAGFSPFLSDYSALPGIFQYIEIELASGTLYMRHSANGYAYTLVGSTTVAYYLGAITDVGIFTFVNNSSYGIRSVVDWFRRIS